MNIEEELSCIKIAYANCTNDLARSKIHLKEVEEELACVKIAYANCINDLSRSKNHLKEAEDTLLVSSNLLKDKASTLQIKREDNPGSYYSSKKNPP